MKKIYIMGMLIIFLVACESKATREFKKERLQDNINKSIEEIEVQKKIEDIEKKFEEKNQELEEKLDEERKEMEKKFFEHENRENNKNTLDPSAEKTVTEESDTDRMFRKKIAGEQRKKEMENNLK